MERSRAARLLGVDVTATPDQLRAAFRARAREVHPDRAGGDSAAMAELNAAYETLGARAGEGWAFADPSTPDPHISDPTTDDDRYGDPPDPQLGGWSLLRAFPIVVGFVGLVVTAIVFVVAIGYDWSLSP